MGVAHPWGRDVVDRAGFRLLDRAAHQRIGLWDAFELEPDDLRCATFPSRVHPIPERNQDLAVADNVSATWA